MGAAPESGIVVPVPPADAVVGEWRAAHDPAAALGVPAHVTVLYPFLAPPVPSAAIDALRAFFALVPPWEAAYASFGRFPGGVLYLAPDDPAPFVALADALAGTWPDCPPYGGAHDMVIPHLTICDGAPEPVLDEAEAAVAARLPVRAWARAAWLMSQGEAGGAYALEARLPFGG